MRRAFGQSESSDRGLAFIELVFIFPIILTLLFGIAYLYRYFHLYQAVKHASELAAAVASSAEIAALGDPTKSYLRWTHESGVGLPERPVLELLSENCRASHEADEALACLQEQFAKKRAEVLTLTESGPIGVFQKGYPLPFELSEPSRDTPGYNLVQMLPIIGIERACLEPFNETGTIIAFNPSRYFQAKVSNPNECRHVRPMYWQSPVKADFDGDHKEDLVFFRPQGDGSAGSKIWGAIASRKDLDFIVYYSGGAYSLSAGLGFFNLAIDENPRPIPIIADYDRDGLSDYAVFEPISGLYRVAFSSTRFKTIKEAYIGIKDPNGEYGLLAIPGTFEKTHAMQVAVIQTGADTGAERFQIWLTPPIELTYAQIIDPDHPLPEGDLLSSLKVESEAHKYKPHPGTVSVPAFADYDDDGLVEAGYLSWYGGNLSKQFAGKVKGVANPDASDIFEQAPYTTKTSLEVRMNPFRLAVDSRHNMYYVDSIDHRIWALYTTAVDSENNPVTSSAQIVMPHHRYLSPRNTAGDFNYETDFPGKNVRDLPVKKDHEAYDDLSESEDQPAGGRVLKYPGAIAIGPDDAMYIADTQNGRILMVKDDNANGIDSRDNSKLILGSNTCPKEACNPLSDSTEAPVRDEVSDGPYQIWPTALAIVPLAESGQPYALAFATKYGVYLLTPAATALGGGPQGAAGEGIYKIAGIQAQPPSAPPQDIHGYAHDYSFASVLVANNAQASRLCPVTDLEYGKDSRSVFIIASVSCSLVGSDAIGDSSPPPAWFPGGLLAEWANTGAIIKIRPGAGSSFTTTLNRIERVAGSLLAFPCHNGLCSAPREDLSGAGVFQRKIDITASLLNLDLINPVDVEISTGNSIFFIDQYNDAPHSSSEYFPTSSGPAVSDHQHAQGIYRIDTVSSTIVPLTNPYAFAQGTIPVQGADWYSPFRLGSQKTSEPYILAHEAPLKNIPLPAVSSLKILGSYLYAATPFLANPQEYYVTDELPFEHPFLVDPAKIGFIYRIALDADGDGIKDDNDPDIDGDGVPNEDDTRNGRSQFCPEIYGSSDGSCRVQEKVGNPLWYFFKLDGGTLYLSGEANAPAESDYAEFFLVNSVAENGPTTAAEEGPMPARKVRPEVWATLLNFGDDQDFPSGICPLASDSTASPYFACQETSNGPIAIPHVLNSFVGDPAVSAYHGKGFLASAVMGSARDPLGGLFLFPAVLSSTRPRENGIKVTRRIPADKTKNPGVRKSGVLCWDYTFEKANASEPVAAQNKPFSLNSEQYLKNYPYSGFEAAWDSAADNDNLNYMADCNGPPAPFPDGRSPAVEGIVLQLDHDDTDEKESGASSTTWPHPWITGPPELPENQREFLLIDHDGRGLRMPTWLLSYIPEPPDTPGLPKHVYLLASINREASSPTNGLGLIMEARRPFSVLEVLIGLGWLDLDQQVIRPPFLATATGQDSDLVAGLNFKFDAAMTIKGQSTGAMLLSLDFEPFLARTLKVDSVFDVGSAMYRNYTQSNRFMTVSGAEPPPLTAARNALKLALGLTDADFVSSKSDLEKDKAFIGFLRKVDNEWLPCASGDDGEQTSSSNCDGIEVVFQTTFLGKTLILSERQAFLYSNLTPYLQQCDPDAPKSYPCPL